MNTFKVQMQLNLQGCFQSYYTEQHIFDPMSQIFHFSLCQYILKMMKQRISIQKEYHRNSLINALKIASDKLSTPHVYFEQRAHQIVTAILEQSEILGTGLTQILTNGNVPQSDFERIVIVTVMSPSAMTQIERYLHLFREVFIVNLTISGSGTKALIGVSPLRKKLKGFYEISLNFLSFIDSVYFSKNLKKLNQDIEQVTFEESLSSFLMSFPKFHQFQIQVINKSSGQQLGNSIKTLLEEKLKILQNHNSKQYHPQSSPRVKVLILQRKIDQMSPLVYSYHFGPISKQIQVFDKRNRQFTSNSSLYTTLFPLDIHQAGQFLRQLAQQKSNNQKLKFQLNQFDKAKKAISNQYDQKSSPQQIELQIDALDSVKQFCKRRAATTAFQQTIINARSQVDEQMSARKTVDKIMEWASIPLQEFKPSQEDYVKILVLSYMVNSFWFWHRRIINAGLEGPHKEKVISFCKKIENKFKPLPEKKQAQERQDLYRHEPTLVLSAKKWIQKEENQTFVRYNINESSINRQQKVVIAINGPLGYGQLAMLIKEVKNIKKNEQFIIFSQSLVTTKEYLSILLKSTK